MLSDSEIWQGPVQRRMTPRRFKEFLQIAGLNQTTAARYLGISIRTVRRMAAGTAKIPTAVVLLLNLMERDGVQAIVPEKKKRRAR